MNVRQEAGKYFVRRLGEAERRVSSRCVDVWAFTRGQVLNGMFHKWTEIQDRDQGPRCCGTCYSVALDEKKTSYPFQIQAGSPRVYRLGCHFYHESAPLFSLPLPDARRSFPLSPPQLATPAPILPTKPDCIHYACGQNERIEEDGIRW